jgi:acyl carrier protein
MPERPEVLRRLCRLAAEQVGADPLQVTAETSFIADLNYDSLNVVDFVMQVEDAFKLSIPDEEAEGIRGFKTVGEVADLVMRLGSGHQAPAE